MFRKPERSPRPSLLAGAFLAAALAVPALALPERLAVPPAAAPAQDGARALIQDTADRVIALLNDASLNSRDRRERIIELVDQRLDMGVVTRLVLAKHFKRFTPEQEAEFRKEFRQHLIETYYRNAETAKVQSIEIYESREEERGDWTVRSRVKSTEQGDTLIDYRLRKSKDTGNWLIIDITIEQVSLVANFRSQFSEVLSNKEPAALIEMLREKNAKAETDNAATDKTSDADAAKAEGERAGGSSDTKGDGGGGSGNGNADKGGADNSGGKSTGDSASGAVPSPGSPPR